MKMTVFCFSLLLLLAQGYSLRYPTIRTPPLALRIIGGGRSLVPVKNQQVLPLDKRQSPSPTALHHSTLQTLWPQIMTAFYVNLPGAAFLLYSNQKSLTRSGLAHATMLGVGLWSALGWRGWGMGVIYFILGSVVTKIKMAEKEVGPHTGRIPLRGFPMALTDLYTAGCSCLCSG